MPTPRRQTRTQIKPRFMVSATRRDISGTLRARLLLGFLFVTALVIGWVIWRYGPPTQDLVEIYHIPDTFARRAGDLTANITGAVSPWATGTEYRLNDGPWHDVGQGGLRAPPPAFTIELTEESLRSGRNTLSIRSSLFGLAPQVTPLSFSYNSSPVDLPVRVDWAQADLDAQDGYWERVSVDGGWRVRPRPGFEGYDRILIVTGAFSQARRVSTEVVFRGYTRGRKLLDFVRSPLFGFGVLPLWGGRPDTTDAGLRRGWYFGIGWYYSHYNGVGLEFSTRMGGGAPDWVSSYRNLSLEEDTRYFIVIEAWPETDASGGHLGYRQRMRWWSAYDSEPAEWIELADVEGAPLPVRDYAVALVAHRAQVEFGPVLVEPLSKP